jgi:hypothetical protein
MSKKKISERDLSIICGLADLGKIGMYDIPEDSEDEAFQDICSACVAENLRSCPSLIGRDYPHCYLSADDIATDGELAKCGIAPGFWIGMRFATPDDVALLLSREDDE